MMSKFMTGQWLPGFRRVLLSCLALAILMATRMVHADEGSLTNGGDFAYVPWGNPEWTTNDFTFNGNWPGWMVSAFQSGGEWDTNLPAWRVPAATSNNTGFLQLEVDRSLLSNNVLMRTWFLDTTGATIYVDLVNTNETVVVTNLLGINLLTGSGTASVNDVSIPFADRLDAVGIRLRRGMGEVEIYGSLLVPNTTNSAVGEGGNTDNSQTTATVSGSVSYHGTQFGYIYVVAVTNANGWSSPWIATLASPGTYVLPGLPVSATYWIRAYMDANGNGSNDSWEATGAGFPAPLQLVCSTNVDIALTELDSNGDGLSDWMTLQLGLDQYSNVCSRLPFIEMFETNTVHVGDANGQNGWVAGATNTAFVQTNNVFAGQQALLINGASSPVSASHYFSSSGASQVWVDLYMDAQIAQQPTNLTSSAGAFYFNADGLLVVLDGLQPAGHQWVVLTNTPPVTFGSWVRITLCLDYAAQRWLICLNGKIVADGLGFTFPCNALHSIRMQSSHGFMDNVCVTTNEPDGVSTTGNQISDNWLMEYFGNLNQTDSGDSDHDGLSNLQEYLLGSNPLVSNGCNRLPFSEMFETNTVQVGDVNGQNGWLADANTVFVQTNTVFAGQQALLINGAVSPASASHYFFPSGSSQLWVDLYMDAQIAQPPTNISSSAGAFYFNADGLLVVLDGLQPAGQQWVVLTNTPPVTFGTWVRISLRLDYAAQRWLICLNGKIVANGMGFAFPCTDLHSIRMQSAHGFMDNVGVTTNEPDGVSMEGNLISDNWQMQYFGNLNQIDSGDPDHDGLSNLQEYLLGTNPTTPDSNNDGILDFDSIQWGLRAVATNIFAAIPWSTDFEPTAGYAPGSLLGQNGWVVPFGTATVEQDTAFTNSQAVRLSPASGNAPVAGLFLQPVTNTVAWTDFRIKTSPGGLPSVQLPGLTAVFCGGPDGNWAGLDGATWRAATNATAVLSGWMHATIRQDFAVRKWDLYIGPNKVFSNLAFSDTNANHFTRFAIVGGSSADTFIDLVNVGTALPGWIDMDGDGLTNDQKAHYGIDPLNLNLSAAGDGMFDGTAVRLGFNPLVSNRFMRIDAAAGTDTWTTGFESSEGYAAGGLNGQNGWIASNGVQVINTISHAGTQSVMLPGADSAVAPPKTMSANFGALGRNNLWLSFYAHVQQGMPDTNAFAGPAALKFFVSCNRVYAYDGDLKDWRVSVPMDISTNWVRFDVCINNGRQKYLICVNGLLALDEINFGDPTCISPGAFDVIGSAGTNLSTCVDDLRLSAAGPEIPLQLTGNITGTVTYTGFQTGLVHVVAATTSNGWTSGYSTVLAAPGDFVLTNLPLLRTYWVKAWIDSNGNDICDPTEAVGLGVPAPVMPVATNTVVQVMLTDLDTIGDGVPDWWKILNYGSISNVNAAASADPDHDGLTNLQDYQLGAGTNRVTLNGSATNSAVGAWTVQGTDLVSANQRGSVDYTMNCPDRDMYLVTIMATHEIAASFCSPIDPTGESDLLVYIDGRYIGKCHLVASDGIMGTVAILTPLLNSGPHDVQIVWENVNDRVHLRIHSVILKQFNGPKSNGNGVKDWVEQDVASNSGIDAVPASSVVSPLCVEGNGRYADMISICVNGSTLPARPGTFNRWYADVPLSPTGSGTTFSVSFQDGAYTRSASVMWTPLNLLGASDITIRAGDALMLTARPDGVTNGTVSITVQGITNYLTTALQPVSYAFPTAGTYSVVGTYDNGTPVSGTLSVTVVGGAFPTNTPACMLGRTRTWACSNMPPNTVLQADNTVALAWSNQVAMLTMSAIYDDHYLVARIATNGPILASTRLDGFWIQSAVDSHVWVVETYPDGSMLIQDTLVAKKVPPSVAIEIRPIIAGVTFDDLSLDRWIGSADLDPLGQYTFGLLRPASVQASVCHTIKAYQDGVLLGEAYYSGLMPVE